MRGTKSILHGVLATALLTGCGDSTEMDPVTAPPGGGNGSGGGGGAITVSVGNNLFRSDRNGSTNAAVDTVLVGGKVTWKWVNSGSVPHNVASVGMPSFTSGGVKTGNGSTYEITFTSPGTYRYNCAIHGNLMTGVVVVTAPAPAPSVSLGDVVIPNLPSPYYHFEYDTLGRVGGASFASGLAFYNVDYAGDRISQIRAMRTERILLSR